MNLLDIDVQDQLPNGISEEVIAETCWYLNWFQANMCRRKILLQ